MLFSKQRMCENVGIHVFTDGLSIGTYVCCFLEEGPSFLHLCIYIVYSKTSQGQNKIQYVGQLTLQSHPYVPGNKSHEGISPSMGLLRRHA